MPKKVAKDSPLFEITLRKYEKPGNLKGRDLFKKICLSLGLLQPGDSRDVIVDILQVIAESKKPLNMPDIEKKVKDNREKNKLVQHGIALSNITRQVRRLKQLFLVEYIAGKYRINENDTLSNIFEESIKKYYISSITERIKEYLERLDTKK